MIKIYRHTYNTTNEHRNVIGDLFLDNDYCCYTLEDEKRADGVKIYGETAIPSGEYSIKLTYSNRFKRILPLIYNNKDLCVHGKNDIKWCGIRIHGGNTEANTLGCILVAMNTDYVKIWNSKPALNKIIKYLEEKGGEDILIIEDRPFTYDKKNHRFIEGL